MRLSKTLTFMLMTFLMSLTAFAEEYMLDSDTILGFAAIIFFVPAVIAFIMMFIKLSRMNTATKQKHADNYMKREAFKIDIADDIFLYSNTVRTPKPKNKN